MFRAPQMNPPMTRRKSPRGRAKVLHFAQTPYGFEWGAAVVTRLFSDDRKGWVTIGLNGLQIYVTKTGKVRIHDDTGEWQKAHPRRRAKQRRGT